MERERVRWSPALNPEEEEMRKLCSEYNYLSGLLHEQYLLGTQIAKESSRLSAQCFSGADMTADELLDGMQMRIGRLALELAKLRQRGEL